MASNPSINAVKKVPGYRVRALAFSPGCGQLASAHTDGLLAVWRIEYHKSNGGTVALKNSSGGFRFSRDEPICAVSWSPDGKRLVTCSDYGCVCSWDLLEREPTVHRPVDRVPPIQITFAVFSPDSDLLAFGGAYGSFYIWNIENSTMQADVQGDEPQYTILDAQFNAQGKRIMTRSKDGRARIWNAHDGGPHLNVSMKGCWVQDASFSPGGDFALTVTEGGGIFMCGKFLTAPNQYNWCQLAGYGSRSVKSARFSPNDTLLATAWYDGTLRLYRNAEGWEVIPAQLGPPGVGMPHGGEVTLIAFFGDDVLVSGADDGTVRVWPIRLQT